MPSLVALGVVLPGTAHAEIIIPTYQAVQQDLDTLPNVPTATNSATVTATGVVNVPATDAIVGAARPWTLTNQGSVTGGDHGVYLQNGTANAVINSGTITGIYGGVQVGNGTGTVTNQATISGTSGFGIRLNAGGGVANQGAAANITGDSDGILIDGSVGTVTNEGTITGSTGSGISLKSGGSVTNLGVGSLISGYQNGVSIRNGIGTVLNQGTIGYIGCGCGSIAGVAIGTYGGSVTNQGTAANIIGAYYGVLMHGAGTVTNEGTIAGAAGIGVQLEAGGAIFNRGAGSEIAGFSIGVYLAGAGGTIVNQGTIKTLIGYGVTASAGGTVTNQGTASLIAGVNGGIAMIGGAGIVTNQGTISASSGTAVALAGGGSLANQGAASRIAAYGGDGVSIANGPGTVTNDGQITANSCGCGPVDGVYLAAGGSVTNNAGAAVQADTNGIQIQGGLGTIVNGGAITGTAAYGITLAAGGAVTNRAGGTITGGSGGIAVAGGAGIITNAGRIVSGAGPAVVFTGAFNNTLTNSGTISNGSGTTAIRFDSGDDTLVLQTGSVLGGDADGGAGTNTLILQGTGTESHDFINFQNIMMQGSNWRLTGTVTAPGGTIITLGRLAINGTLTTPTVLVTNTGTLAGSGTITSTVTNNGVIAPGNSIGTLTISGAYVQAAGSHYQVEVDASGASDKIVVNGAPGTATINGGSVDVIPAAGAYAKTTTYSILTATGGITGSYAAATSTSAFLVPSLSYGGGAAFLTLTRDYAGGGATVNQRAVGAALDQGSAGAGADFQSATGSLIPLSGLSAQNALDQLGGEPYSSFATVQMRSAQLFANTVGQQMAQSHGAADGAPLAQNATRVQLAAVGATAGYLAPGTAGGSSPGSPWTAWSSAFGVSGGVAGDGNAHDVGYTLGGAAFGLDRRIDPTLVVGAAFAYSRADASASGLPGRATSNVYQGALYASHAGERFYVDGLAGYGYDSETMKRNIAFGDLSRSTTGDTHAHQFFAALETGYAVRLADAAVLTPYAGVQAASAIQAHFVESGANGLDLAVQGKTTNSLRGILGAGIAKTIDMTGRKNPLSVQLRAGWAHEFADADRAVTASFVGAPGSAFTVQGASSGRDSAVIGLAAQTALSTDSSLFLRYDGDLNGGDDAHSVTGGIRITW